MRLYLVKAKYSQLSKASSLSKIQVKVTLDRKNSKKQFNQKKSDIAEPPQPPLEAVR